MNNTYCKRSNYELILKSTNNEVQASLCCKSQHPVNLSEKDKLTQIKKDLNNGIKNEHCSICWKEEEKGQQSWRQIGNDINFFVKSIEIYFDNTCDQACIYCDSKYSSKWSREIKSLDNNEKLFLKSLNYNTSTYPTIKKNHKDKILNEIVQISKNASANEIINILILGGEPFLTQQFKKTNILKEIVENFYSAADKKTTLFLTIFTNGNTTDKIIDKIILISKTLKKQYTNLEITVQISIESTDKNAEYVRYGLDYKQFYKNYIKYLLNDICVGFCMTVNTVSLVDTPNFLKQMFDTARLYNKKIFFNLNLVNYPEFLSIKTLPTKYQNIFENCELIIKENQDIFINKIFYNRMIIQINHAKQTLGTDVDQKHKENAKKYFLYLNNKRNIDIKEANFELYKYLEN